MNRIWIAFLVIASLLDASLTDVGLRLHLIGEANPIMSFLYEHLYIGFYAFKVALPLSLFFLVSRIRRQGYLVRGMLHLSVLVYIGILGMHYYWITASLNMNV